MMRSSAAWLANTNLLKFRNLGSTTEPGNYTKLLFFFVVSKLKKNELQLLLNAAYQHMHKVPPDMRKALLIAAQERMDKLSMKSVVEQTAAPSAAQVPAPSKEPAPAKSKEDDDLVILQEVSSIRQFFN